MGNVMLSVPCACGRRLWLSRNSTGLGSAGEALDAVHRLEVVCRVGLNNGFSTTMLADALMSQVDSRLSGDDEFKLAGCKISWIR